MKLYVGNAFSLSMLSRDVQLGNDPLSPARIPIPVRDEDVKFIVSECLRAGTIESCIGHSDTARLFSSILGIELPVNRMSIKLDNSNERILVGQYTGQRLPEGSTTLPEGATIEWWMV